MTRLLTAALLVAGGALGQQAPSPEQAELSRALGEAGSSKADVVRALERHLEKHPDSPQRAELERAITATAIEAGDRRRTLLYGERVLTRDPSNVDLLERVSRLLLDDDGNLDQNRRALEYAQRMEAIVTARPQDPPGTPNAARRFEERQILLGRALVHQARALGNLGQGDAAVAKARASFAASASAESAREIGRWLERGGRPAEAIPFLAEAFLMTEAFSQAESRAKDRAKLAELSKKAGWTDAALGEEILKAQDRIAARIAERKALLQSIEPNSQAATPMDYVISGLDDDSLDLATLKGKVVVLDFWATWCEPCRAQQPLYESVEQHFKDNPDVVFVNVSGDENRSLVKPFLARNGWNKTAYFDDGLAAALKVESLPTTIVFNRRAEVASRMNGYIKERFVDMLTERIEQALTER